MLKYKIKFREATFKDRQALYQLNRESLPVVYSCEQWAILVGQKLDTKKERNCVYVLTLSDQIVGYSACDQSGCIISFAIHSKYRQMGYGRQLLMYCCDEMKIRGHTQIILRVKVSNQPAINLYTSVGFKTIEVLSKYYTDGEVEEDGYLMKLDLNLFK